MVDEHSGGLRIDILVRAHLDRHALQGASPLRLREVYQRSAKGQENLLSADGAPGEHSPAQFTLRDIKGFVRIGGLVSRLVGHHQPGWASSVGSLGDHIWKSSVLLLNRGAPWVQIRVLILPVDAPTGVAQPRDVEADAVLLSGNFRSWPAAMRSLVSPLAALMACTVVPCVRAIRRKLCPDLTTQ